MKMKMNSNQNELAGLQENGNGEVKSATKGQLPQGNRWDRGKFLSYTEVKGEEPLL